MISQSYLKLVRSLQKKKQRNEHSLFLVEGIRNCEELKPSKFNADRILYTSQVLSNKRAQTLIDGFSSTGVDCDEISPEEMNLVSDAVTGQGIVAIVQIPQEKTEFDENMNSVVCLVSVSDPGNLGTIIRTASWFGIDGIFISEDSVDLYSPKVVRSSAGAIFQIQIFTGVDPLGLMDDYKSHGFSAIAAVPHGGKNIYDFTFPDKSVLFFGSEATGLSEEIASSSDHEISIPMSGKGDSLNLAVAFGIVIGLMGKTS